MLDGESFSARLARPQVPWPQLAAVDHHRERAPHLDPVVDERLPRPRDQLIVERPDGVTSASNGFLAGAEAAAVDFGLALRPVQLALSKTLGSCEMVDGYIREGEQWTKGGLKGVGF